MKNILIKLIITLTKTYIQILLSVLFACLAYMEIKYSSSSLTNKIEFREIAMILASIASILALITSITFAFVMSNMNSANNRVESLLIEYKNFLFKMDDYLESLPSNIPIVEEARIISHNLKFVENNDIPLNDWDERLEDFLKELDNKNGFDSDPNLGNKILEYLGYVEYILGEIGVLRIRQIVAGIFIKTLFKGFALLSLMIATILIVLVFHQDMKSHMMVVFPVMFGTLTSLMILEIGWWIKREENEMMSFIEDEKAPNNSEEPIKNPQAVF